MSNPINLNDIERFNLISRIITLPPGIYDQQDNEVSDSIMDVLRQNKDVSIMISHNNCNEPMLFINSSSPGNYGLYAVYWKGNSNDSKYIAELIGLSEITIAMLYKVVTHDHKEAVYSILRHLVSRCDSNMKAGSGHLGSTDYRKWSVDSDLNVMWAMMLFRNGGAPHWDSEIYSHLIHFAGEDAVEELFPKGLYKPDDQSDDGVEGVHMTTVESYTVPTEIWVEAAPRLIAVKLKYGIPLVKTETDFLIKLLAD